MLDAIDIKKGVVLKLDGELYVVSFSQFVNPRQRQRIRTH